MFYKLKTRMNSIFEEKILSYFGPKTIRISPVGYACTNACPMCWRMMKKITKKGGLEKTELKYKKYEELINSLSFTTSTIEVVGGGEPLLFPGIEKLLQKIKERNKFGSLITNGVLMTRKISSILVDIKWNSVRVSINSGSREIYKLVNGSSYFDQVVNNVRTLVNMKKVSKFPKVGLHFVLQKSNYQDIGNFLKLASQIGVDFVNFDTLIHDSPKELRLSEAEIKTVQRNLNRVGKTFNIESNIKEVLERLKQSSTVRKKQYFSDKYCHIVQSNLDIDSEGNVVPCCMAYGEKISKKIDKSSVSKIWKSNKSFRRRLKQGQFEAFCYKKCNYSLKKIST